MASMHRETMEFPLGDVNSIDRATADVYSYKGEPYLEIRIGDRLVTLTLEDSEKLISMLYGACERAKELKR